MGFNEDFVFSLSSSKGLTRDEDCTLIIWDAATLGIPQPYQKLKKNHNAQLRNCVHPSLKEDVNDPDVLYVMLIAEYMPNSEFSYTGFMTYLLKSDYRKFDFRNGFISRDIQYIDNQRYVITGAYNPSHEEWWAVATKDS